MKEQKSTKLLYHQCHDAALRCAVVAVVAVVAVAVVAFVVAVIVAAVAAVVAVVVVIAVVIVVSVGGGVCQCIVMSLYNIVIVSMQQRMHAIPRYHCIIVRHGINGPTDKPPVAECP